MKLTKVRENGNLAHLYRKKMTEQQAKEYAFKKCTEAENRGAIYAWNAYKALVSCAMTGLYDSDYRIP